MKKLFVLPFGLLCLFLLPVLVSVSIVPAIQMQKPEVEIQQPDKPKDVTSSQTLKQLELEKVRQQGLRSWSRDNANRVIRDIKRDETFREDVRREPELRRELELRGRRN